jgi:hypothetical protein
VQLQNDLQRELDKLAEHILSLQANAKLSHEGNNQQPKAP